MIENSQKKIIYYAHRKEVSIKLKKMEQLGFLVIKNEEPFENLFGNLRIIPQIIYSFYSPILLNLDNIYQNTSQLIIIEIDDKYVIFNNEIIKNFYREYKKNLKLNLIKY